MSSQQIITWVTSIAGVAGALTGIVVSVYRFLQNHAQERVDDAKALSDQQAQLLQLSLNFVAETRKSQQELLQENQKLREEIKELRNEIAELRQQLAQKG